MLICDEPVSALDVSVQAQVLNILEDMKARYGLTLLFISHDLSVVKNVSDRIIVMYLGKVCEIGNADELYEHPRHPYTRALLASIPEPAPTVDVSEGDIEGELPRRSTRRRMPVQHPVPARHGHLFHRRTGDAAGRRQRPLPRLPPPGRGLGLGRLALTPSPVSDEPRPSSTTRSRPFDCHLDDILVVELAEV